MMYLFLDSLHKVQSKNNFYFDREKPEKRPCLDTIVDRNINLYNLVKEYDNYEDKLTYLEDVAKIFHE